MAAIWESMWRDGRKYGVFLHLLAQTRFQNPPGYPFFLREPVRLPDQGCQGPNLCMEGPRHDEVPHLGKSEKGMVNTEYKRYLARIPKTYAMHKQPVVKLGYSADVYNMVPIAAWRSAAAGKSLSRPV